MKALVRTSVFALLATACTSDDVPATLSFQQDIAPILAANCVRCHGVPAIGGATSGFRLDTFDSYVVQSTGPDLAFVGGAAMFSPVSAVRVASEDAPMPPRFPLDDDQIEILTAWAGNPVRGEPRPGNRAPTATLITTSPAAGGLLIELAVRDADPDLVGGVLRAFGPAGMVPVALLHDGDNRVTVRLEPGSYRLEAALDDGGAETTINLGDVSVEAP